MNSPSVIAVVATYRRAPEVARLLASLARIPAGLRSVIVVDNAADPATRAAVAASPLAIEYLPQPRNLGCGGALAVGERAALARQGDHWTHLWILDDDTEIAPDCLGTLVAAMAAAGADAAHPLVVDAQGHPGWAPGLLVPEKYRVIQRAATPGEYLARCGAGPVPFSWSQGIALLVTRTALDRHGPHREDYWVRGEDLEFSLRLTYRGCGIYVPAACVRHLPPPEDSAASREGEYRKHCAMLQNIAYTAFRLPHGRRIARTIPGNWWRFLRIWGLGFAAIGDAARAFLRGACLGQPAGATAPLRP